MRRTVVAIGLLVGMLFALGCGSMMSARPYRSARLQRYPPPPSERTLQSGDRIRIYLHVPNPDVLDRVIDGYGNVTLPNLGLVKIGGLSTARAEEVIRNAYISQRIYKAESIQVAIVPPVSEFYVQGQVRRPGSFGFTRNLTVLQAVSMAGGPTEFADGRIRRLIRRGEIYIIDAKKVTAGEEPDRFVEPGDIIDVPRGIL